MCVYIYADERLRLKQRHIEIWTNTSLLICNACSEHRKCCQGCVIARNKETQTRFHFCVNYPLECILYIRTVGFKKVYIFIFRRLCSSPFPLCARLTAKTCWTEMTIKLPSPVTFHWAAKTRQQYNYKSVIISLSVCVSLSSDFIFNTSTLPECFSEVRSCFVLFLALPA